MIIRTVKRESFAFHSRRVRVAVLSLTSLIGLAGFQPMSSQTARFDFRRCIVESPKENVQTTINSRILVDRDQLRTVFDLRNSTLVIENFPTAPQRNETVELKLDHVWTADDVYGEYSDHRTGKRIPYKFPTQQFYVGTIGDNKNTRVTISYANGELISAIHDAHGEAFDLVPLGAFTDVAQEHSLTKVDESVGNRFRCYTEVNGNDVQIALEKKNLAPKTLATDLRDVDVALEIDAAFTRKFGGDMDRALAYASAVLSSASIIYVNDVNVRLKLKVYHIWEQEYVTDPDLNQSYPYKSVGEIGKLLGEFQAHWNQNYSSAKWDRDIAHMMSGPTTQSGVSAGGVAYRNTLCSKTGCYGVSGIYGTSKFPEYQYTWDGMVATHEIGHQLGCPHTHSCDGHGWFSPPLDTCVTRDDGFQTRDACFASPTKPKFSRGTIMSYCHLPFGRSDLTFGPVMSAKLRTNLEGASCIRKSAEGIVVLTYPLGKQTIEGGTTVNIKWHSSGVDRVNVEYSSDDMKNWTSVASDVVSALKTTPWNVPSSNSTTGWVRVYDPLNTTVADTSWVSFNVSSATIALSFPVGGEKLGLGEKYDIRWSRSVVKNVNVEVRIDGGAWTIVANNIDADLFPWSIPKNFGASSNVELRVVSVSNGALVSQSKPFATGTPTATCLAPASGESLCIGSKYRIRFNAQFYATTRILYSIDDGVTFPASNRVTLSASADSGFFVWTVPAKKSQKVKLAFYTTSDVSTPVTISETFTLDSCAVGVQDTELALTLTQPIVAEGGSTLLFDVSSSRGESDGTANIFDIQGRKMQTVAITVSETGRRVALPLSDLPIGTYILEVRSGSINRQAAFSLAR